MRKHRYAALVLVAGLTFGACAESKATGGTAAETEQTETEQTETEQTETKQTETEQTETVALRLLHPLINHQYRIYYDDSGAGIETLEWDSIEFAEDETQEYSALAAVVREQFEEAEAAFVQNAELSLGDAGAYLNENGADWDLCFGFERSVELHRCDSQVFSYMLLDYQFTGGAHPMYGYGGYSYDAKTGKLLTAEDIFTDRQRLAAAIAEVLSEKYPADVFFDAEGLLDSVTEYIDNGVLNVVLTNLGPRVIFNPDEIGPYASGALSANIYPENYPDLVKPEYVKTAESWMIKLPADDSLYIDVDGDGVPEDIRYSERIEYEEDYSDSRITGIDVFAGAEQVTIPTDSYFSECYFVRDRGKSVLYIMQATDNDYRLLDVIDLTDKKMAYDAETCRINAAVAVRDWDYADDEPLMTGFYQRSYTLTDPGNMYLESRTEYLSTAAGNRMMHAGEDGVPVPNAGSEYFRIEHFMFDFTALQDVTGTLIDENGNEAGEYTIRAGETVRYVMTDNETFGDVQTVDGTIVRLRMVREAWPYTINGIGLEELFDGILFAG